MAYLGVIGTTEALDFPAHFPGMEIGRTGAQATTEGTYHLAKKFKPLVISPDGHVGEVFAPGTLVHL